MIIRVLKIAIFILLITPSFGFATEIRINFTGTQLAWNIPTIGVPTSYRIYWRSSAQSYDRVNRSQDVGNVLIYNISALGLTLYQVYFWVVTTSDIDSESGYSNEIQGKYTDQVPQTLTIGGGSRTLSW